MEMLTMSFDISLISNIASINLLKQSLTANSGANTLNSLLSSVTGTTSSLSGTSATSQLSTNLSTLSLVTASGALTQGNPLSVFSGAQDAESLTQAVTKFASAFNKAVSAMSGSSSAISTQSAESLGTLAEANAAALEAVGITIDDGKLVVDEEKLADVAENNPGNIKAAFNDTTFAATISAKARSAISQVLGLNNSAGFLAMYTSNLNSGTSGLLSSLYSGYL